MLGTALILVYYVIFGFATSVGFGVDKMATGFSATANPYYVIANSVWGKAGTILVLLALVNSGWGCSLAGQTAVLRVYYKMGKVGVLPRALGSCTPSTTRRTWRSAADHVLDRRRPDRRRSRSARRTRSACSAR